jgi:hypothetical protein
MSHDIAIKKKIVQSLSLKLHYMYEKDESPFDEFTRIDLAGMSALMLDRHLGLERKICYNPIATWIEFRLDGRLYLMDLANGYEFNNGYPITPIRNVNHISYTQFYTIRFDDVYKYWVYVRERAMYAYDEWVDLVSKSSLITSLFR